MYTSGARFGGRQRFYDLHVRVRGPAARQLQALVVETLATANAGDIASELLAHLNRQDHREENSWETDTMLNGAPPPQKGDPRADAPAVEHERAVRGKLRSGGVSPGEGMTGRAERSCQLFGSRLTGQAKEEGAVHEQDDEEGATCRGGKYREEEREQKKLREEEPEGGSEETRETTQQTEGGTHMEGELGAGLLKRKRVEEQSVEEANQSGSVRFPDGSRWGTNDATGEHMHIREESSGPRDIDGSGESQAFPGFALSVFSAVSALHSCLSSFFSWSTPPHAFVSSDTSPCSSSTDATQPLLSGERPGELASSSRRSEHLAASSEGRDGARAGGAGQGPGCTTATERLLATPRRILFSWVGSPRDSERISGHDGTEAKRTQEEDPADEDDDDVDDAHDVLIQVLVP